MLSSRAPSASAGASSGSALSDALTMFNLGHFLNSWLSNTILVGAAQAMNVDEYFAQQPTDNAITAAAREGAWCSLVGQAGGMLRQAVPMLRIW